jgi:hypothetical protein
MNRRTELRVIGVGDVSLHGRFGRLGVGQAFRHVRSEWEGADLLLGNLESPLATTGRVAESKVTLRAVPGSVEALRAARFDALALANNHAMDFGPGGLAETMSRLDEAGIPHVGAGPDNDSAVAPLVLERRGQAVGLLSFCDVEQSSPLYATCDGPGVAALKTDEAVRAVRELRPRVDWVVVQLHWGVEMASLPSPGQREQARRLVEAGADLILGHHSHVLQPMEVIAGVPVFYSLGNFLFSDVFWRGRDECDQPFVSCLRIHPISRKSGWAEVELRRGEPTRVRFVPARIRRDLSVVRDESPQRLQDWDRLCRTLEVENYADAFHAEVVRARERLRWVGEWRVLRRRIELTLFKYGLLLFAPEAT